MERVERLTTSLRFRLPLLVIAVALPAVALTVWTGIERRQDAADASRAQALQLARSVAGGYEDTIQSGRDFIGPVAAFLGLFPEEQLAGLTTAACATFFAQFLGPDSRYVSFAIADSAGEPICSSVTGGSEARGTADDFVAMALLSDEPVVSSFRIDTLTGHRVVTIARSITGTSGETNGVTYASLDLTDFETASIVENLPAGSFMTITDRDGTIIARHPDPGAFVGTSGDDVPVFAVMRERREGTVEGANAEGVESLRGFTPIDTGHGETAAFAIVGIPKSDAYRTANFALLRNMLILGAVTAGALLFGRVAAQPWIFGPINRLSAASDRLADGDLEARVGPGYPSGELGELSRAFDAMADRIQFREQEISTLNATLEERVDERTRQLAAANAELEAFSYSVSHDLRAPIRAIDGFSRILVEEHARDLPAEASRYLNLIVKSSVNMTGLIDALLQFSRIGRATMARRSSSLDVVVQDAMDELRAEIGEREIDFQFGELGTAHVDPALMRRVFVNLLSNSIKFTRNTGSARVEIGTETQNGETVYFVRDNGAGFDMKYADKLFGVFQRLHHADEFEGTGVGLATANRVVTRHRGRIWAEAAAGNGAAFFFTIGPEDDEEGQKDGG